MSRLDSKKGGRRQQIHVSVRVRPVLPREEGVPTCVLPDEAAGILRITVPRGATSVAPQQKPIPFMFDGIYDSRTPEVDQERIFKDLGTPAVAHALEGFNSCIFAYGQTGTGKSYTVMGNLNAPRSHGLLPRVLEALFERVGEVTSAGIECRSQVSYTEIYNDKLRDLLAPLNQVNKSLRINHHPAHGSRVTNLSEPVVHTYKEALDLLNYGAKSRSIACTSMNDVSSRSHTIFTLKMEVESADGTRMSKLSVIDLAGREHEHKGGAKDEHNREMVFINRSLFNLAHVIHALAAKEKHVPWRNSKLTQILIERLHGNCQTSMIAAITPAADSFDETISTLRFAQTLKGVSTRPTMNSLARHELANQMEMEALDLRRQLEELTAPLQAPTADSVQPDQALIDELTERLKAAEELAGHFKSSWDDEKAKSEKLKQERIDSMIERGISVDPPSEQPDSEVILIRLCNDSHLNGCVMYPIHGSSGIVDIGSDPANQITVEGIGILPQMCTIQITPDGRILLQSSNDEALPRVFRNGRQIHKGETFVLQHGDRLVVGFSLAFLVSIPGEQQEIVDLDRSLEQTMLEVIDDNSGNFARMRTLAKGVEAAQGSTGADSWLQGLRVASALVDEAQQIAGELNLPYNIEILSCQGQGPEAGVPQLLVVCKDKPQKSLKQRFQLAAERSVNHRSGNLADAVYRSLRCLHPDPEAANNHLMFSVKDLPERLRRMRDFHQEYKNEPERLQKHLLNHPHEDPWTTLSPAAATCAVQAAADKECRKYEAEIQRLQDVIEKQQRQIEMFQSGTSTINDDTNAQRMEEALKTAVELQELIQTVPNALQPCSEEVQQLMERIKAAESREATLANELQSTTDLLEEGRNRQRALLVAERAKFQEERSSLEKALQKDSEQSRAMMQMLENEREALQRGRQQLEAEKEAWEWTKMQGMRERKGQDDLERLSTKDPTRPPTKDPATIYSDNYNAEQQVPVEVSYDTFPQSPPQEDRPPLVNGVGESPILSRSSPQVHTLSGSASSTTLRPPWSHPAPNTLFASASTSALTTASPVATAWQVGTPGPTPAARDVLMVSSGSVHSPAQLPAQPGSLQVQCHAVSGASTSWAGTATVPNRPTLLGSRSRSGSPFRSTSPHPAMAASFPAAPSFCGTPPVPPGVVGCQPMVPKARPVGQPQFGPSAATQTLMASLRNLQQQKPDYRLSWGRGPPQKTPVMSQQVAPPTPLQGKGSLRMPSPQVGTQQPPCRTRSPSPGARQKHWAIKREWALVKESWVETDEITNPSEMSLTGGQSF